MAGTDSLRRALPNRTIRSVPGSEELPLGAGDERGSSDAITLRLEGARAKRGVVLADFETFIDSFLAALRDFDRSRRGAPIKTGGRPEARAEAVTSFRLVGFREGSGIVMIEPELAAQGEETEAMVDAEPAQFINLRALLTSVETETARGGNHGRP